MSEDEYGMTSFKRRKVMSTQDSESEPEDQETPVKTTRRLLKKKQIDLDDLDVINENEGKDSPVSRTVLNLIF